MVKGHNEVIEEPRSAQDSRRAEFFDEPSLYVNNPIGFHIKLNLMKINGLKNSGDNPTNLTLFALFNIDSNKTGYILFENAEGRPGIYDCRKSGRIFPSLFPEPH